MFSLAENSYPSQNQLVVDFDRYVVRYGDQDLPVSLTANELKVLALLVERPGYVQSREKIINVIAPKHKIVERNVDVHIQAVRRKLGDLGKNILTIRGVGYKWADAPAQEPGDRAMSRATRLGDRFRLHER